jgi:hypothetical protein
MKLEFNRSPGKPLIGERHFDFERLEQIEQLVETAARESQVFREILAATDDTWLAER